MKAMFTMDAAFALIVIASFSSMFILMDIEMSTPELSYERMHTQARDAIDTMERVRIADIRYEQVISDLFDSAVLTQEDMNKTLMDTLGMLWASNRSRIAGNITEKIFGEIIGRNFEFIIANETIYNSSEIGDTVAASSRLVSGYMKGRPVSGYMARAQLENIVGKRSSSYVFFGGFVGEGNITASIYDIPIDATITSIYIEMNAGENFRLYINGNYCGNFTKTPGFGVNNWSTSSSACTSSIRAGENNTFGINFTGSDLSKKYIGGGYIRVSYDTSQMTTTQKDIYHFPGIDGIINLYDSLYIPGNITGMRVFLRMFNNYTTFLNIGNSTLLNSSGSNDTQTVFLDSANLSKAINYSEISNKTIPLRLGTIISEFKGSGNADVILITDISGSMDWRLDGRTDGTERSCSSPLINDPSTSRISLVRCLDKDFVDIILNTTGNRVGLVGYSGMPNSIPTSNSVVIRSSLNLTNNATRLKSQINAYDAGGATGTCDSIRQARIMLQQTSNSSRQKFIILMTDGLANVQCKPSPLEVRGCIPQQCPWSSYCPGGGCVYWLDDPCGEWVGNKAVNDTIQEACLARNYTNATIHTIGFGPVSLCSVSNQTLRGVASCGNGMYFASSNASELKDIYRGIAENIVNASYSAQSVNVTQGISTRLYGDSYIEFDYIQDTAAPGYKEIDITSETGTLPGCEGSFFIPGQLRVTNARATSYSGDYWTANLSVRSSATGSQWITSYWLGSYGNNFRDLGDPFTIQFSPSLLQSNDTNSVKVVLGSSPYNMSLNCSTGNKVIYDARIRASVPYSGIFPKISGSNVTVYYDKNYDGISDGSVIVAVGRYINFSSTAKTVDELDPDNAIDDVFMRLLDALNFVRGSGRSGSATNPIDVELSDELAIETTSLSGIPYMWGPVEMSISVW